MAGAADVLAEADLRLEWAYQHIIRFEDEIGRFHASHSYPIIRDVDPQDPSIVQLGEHPPVPPQLNLTASDAVHNIRVSLDYLVCAFALLNNKTCTGNVSFPVANSVQEFGLSQAQDKIKKVAPKAKVFINGLKPYKGGNNVLWAVHEINRADKHRNLLAFQPGRPMFYATPIVNEDETRDPVTQPQYYDYKYALVPVFADLAEFEPESALTLLKLFLGRVSDILKAARDQFFPGTIRRNVFGRDLPAG